MSSAGETSVRDVSALPAPLLAKIFIAALIVRWTYALLLYYFMGDDGLKGIDSITYATNAESFARALQAGTIHGTQWLGSEPYIMPLYQWLTALPFFIFGDQGAISHVLFQGALDSGTCVLVYALARLLDERLALWSAAAAVLNPTQIVLSGLIYNDTPFTFFVVLTMFFSARWIARPNWTYAFAIGCSIMCAALIRVSIVPWGFGAVGLLFCYSLYRRVALSYSIKLIVAPLVLSLGLGLIANRNTDQFGTSALTPQGGDYLALWIYPLAKEAQDRTPYLKSLEDVIARTTARFGPPSTNPFEQSVRYQQIGRELIRNEIQFISLAKSWASGIFINLASPAHLISPPVTQLPRSGFYGTPGNSFFEKVFNYAFRSGNATYSLLLIIGAAGLAVVRAIQVIGLVSLTKHRRYWPMILFAAIWIGYLLILNGPIASPKYRMPLEPLFDIMTGAGLLAISIRWDRRKTHVSQPPASLAA